MTSYNGPRQFRVPDANPGLKQDLDRLASELVRAQPSTRRSVIRWRENIPVPLDSLVIVFTPIAGGTLVLPRPQSLDDGRTVIIAVADGSGPLTVECPRPEESAESKELVQPGSYTFTVIDRVYYVDTAMVGAVPPAAVEFALEADGTSVLGKFDAGTGSVAPIVAGTNDRVFARTGDELSFVQITTDMIQDEAINGAKLPQAPPWSVFANSTAASATYGPLEASAVDQVLARVTALGLTFTQVSTAMIADPGTDGLCLVRESSSVGWSPKESTEIAWTSSTTWVCPTNITGGWLIGYGGGGQGGGGARMDNALDNAAAGGGGGGGGAEEQWRWVDLTPGATYTVTIGTGGSGAGQGASSDASDGTDGADGGSTTFVGTGASETFLGARGGIGGPWNGTEIIAVRAPGGRASTAFRRVLADTGVAGEYVVYFVSEPGSGGAGGGAGFNNDSGASGSTNRRNFSGGAAGSTGADSGAKQGGSGGGGGGGGPNGVGGAGGKGGAAGAATGTIGTAGTAAATANSGAGGGGGGGGGNGPTASGNGGAGGNGASGYLRLIYG